MPTLPSDLSPGGASPYRGYIDNIHGAAGVRGWAVNRLAPHAPPTLALRVGGQTVATLAPSLARNDIAQAMRNNVAAGFLFAPEVLQRAAALANTPFDVLTVYIDGTDWQLDSALPPMRIGDLQIGPPPGEAALETKRPSARLHAAIDRLLVITGLGCMLEGWVLSPQQKLIDVTLRLGGAAFTARPEATYRKPRPDLLAAFPHAEALAADAGFVMLLTGETDFIDLATPTLELILADGATSVLELPPELPRLLGHTATAEDALAFFPSLPAESFFPRFAAASLAAERARRAPAVAIIQTQAPRTFVHVLPDNRSDLFLAFETMAAACREGLLDGITLLASSDRIRAEAPWHLQDLLASHPIPASLFSLADTSQALAALPEILRATGAKRFAYVAAGVFPSRQAYRHAASYLRGGGKAPMFLGLVPEPGARPDRAAAPSSRCFAWTMPAFSRWSDSAPCFLGGHYRDNLLARAGGDAAFHPDLVWSGGSLRRRPIEQAVNETIYPAALA